MSASLREVGLSTHAIGSALGVSKDTIQRDLAGVAFETPAAVTTGMDAVTVTGIDGKTYPATPIPRRWLRTTSALLWLAVPALAAAWIWQGDWRWLATAGIVALPAFVLLGLPMRRQD